MFFIQKSRSCIISTLETRNYNKKVVQAQEKEEKLLSILEFTRIYQISKKKLISSNIWVLKLDLI